MRAIVRQWLVLSLLPRPPRKIDTASIEKLLRARGIDIHRRTIQRDLVNLATVFPLVADNRSKPYGWRWRDDAEFLCNVPTPPGERATKHAIEVRLRGDPSVLNALIEKLQATAPRFTKDLVTVRVEDSNATRRTLLAYAGEIEIVAPTELRAEIVKRAKRILSGHAK